MLIDPSGACFEHRLNQSYFYDIKHMTKPRLISSGNTRANQFAGSI